MIGRHQNYKFQHPLLWRSLKPHPDTLRHLKTTCLWLQCHSNVQQLIEAELADLREILDKDPLWKLGTTWEFKAGTQSSQFHRIPYNSIEFHRTPTIRSPEPVQRCSTMFNVLAQAKVHSDFNEDLAFGFPGGGPLAELKEHWIDWMPKLICLYLPSYTCYTCYTSTVWWGLVFESTWRYLELRY